ncbi:paraquat-inducible protein A [Roseovarius aestuariivivens]|uniref:paraquat-inducible protein A n=1 Tax=Roseovarius aestuariivivens TaxID=1888910 RepID=UPI001FDA5BE9|nr:paraquat-inducible protein A [Roseovarius aestuariivivens]
MEVAGDLRTAREMGLVACRQCMRVSPRGAETCPRCGGALASRDETSLQKVWAWWLLGLACYVPANLYPMLETRTLVSTQSDTIVGGAIDLAHHGAYGVAAIILIASVAIPMAKFIALAGLALGVRYGPQLSEARRHLLYEVVEYIGRWSMIDVFVVAILSSLVQLQALASITPGRASLFFALSVIFTMLSARSFDSRLIWDSDSGAQEHSPAPGQPQEDLTA